MKKLFLGVVCAALVSAFQTEPTQSPDKMALDSLDQRYKKIKKNTAKKRVSRKPAKKLSPGQVWDLYKKA